MDLYGQDVLARLALEAAVRSIPEGFTSRFFAGGLCDWSSRQQNVRMAFSGAVQVIRNRRFALFAHSWAFSLPLIHNFLSIGFSVRKEVIFVALDHDLLRVLAARCIGRRDDYALQQADGRYLRQRAPLSWNLLRLHLAGALTLGTYLIDARGLCRFAVFDADGRSTADDLVALVGVQERLAAAGLASALECSRRGGHLWVFLAAPAAPAVMRRVLLPFCPPGVEFYPKQDRATWSEPGSLIRVPLGVHRRSGRRYPFLHQVGGRLVPVGWRVSETLAWLAGVEPVVLPALPALDQVAPHDTHTYVAQPAVVVPLVSVSSIHAWCAGQESVEVIARYVELDQRGMGCCPFGDHHSDGRDTHPSLWVHEPRGPGAPCWYCHTWGRGGNLFDFLSLYTGLDTRALWARIRAGEQF